MRRGLVHRDIKPANLLFDEEGRVRVADFGVARALAEAAWTEPAGAMVGTARYISPEAAEGKPVDGRADVYSLALVLYEAVTGTVPFVTDTTMGTLAARIGQPLPHDALGPLDDVLARAAAPEVSARLDAAGLAARWARWPPPSTPRRSARHARHRGGGTHQGLPGPRGDGADRPGRASSPSVPPCCDSTAIAPGCRWHADRHQGGAGRDLRRRTERRGRVGIREGAAGAPSARRPAEPSAQDAPVWWIVARWPSAVIMAGGLAGGLRETSSRRHTRPDPGQPAAGPGQAAVDKVHMTLKEGAPVKSITVAAG